MPWGAIIGGLFGGIGAIAGPAISSGTSIAAANISANATEQAAQTEAQAAEQAAQLQAQTAQEAIQQQALATQQALQFQETQYGQTQANLAPFLGAGTNALSTLQSPSTLSFLSESPQVLAGANPQVAYTANQPQWNFQPLTKGTFQQSPGYQYQYNQIMRGGQQANAARTGALSGNMLTGLQQQTAGLANNDWWNAENFNASNYLNQFNAANLGYMQTQGFLGNAYNQRLQGITGQQSNIYQILASLIGGGQNAAASLGGFGQNSALASGNYLTQGANISGNYLTNAANASSNYLTQGANAVAAGQIAQGNIGSNLVSGLGTNLTSAVNNALPYFAANSAENSYDPFSYGSSTSFGAPPWYMA